MKRLSSFFAAVSAVLFMLGNFGCSHSSSSAGTSSASYTVTGSLSNDGAQIECGTITITLSGETFSDAAADTSDFSSYFTAVGTAVSRFLSDYSLTGSVSDDKTVLTLTVGGSAISTQGGSVSISSIPAALLASGAALSGSGLVSFAFHTSARYGTSPDFTKWAEAVTGTGSSVGGLDTAEPADPVENSVNMTELQTTLNQYDSEDDMLPKVKVTYDNNAGKWVIFYTTDSMPTEYSAYTLAQESYTGLLDAVNKSFSYLTSSRTSKEKVLIAASGSTGTAAENTISVVNKSDRMAYTHSITLRGMSNIILDFGGNTVYVDTSEADLSGKNISAFIDLERGANNISIRNLTLTGNPGYGIFMAQAYNIVCANIHFAKAAGESSGCSIGIRPQSIANAGTNVEFGRWSHDLYFKNISGNGIGEHVVETFNAYNVYMDEISGTDIGGNAVLLNGTYSATIGTITGVRCCSGGGYAAFRCANDVGPDVNVHYVYSEGCGRGIFFVSSITGVTIDKVNILNAVQGCLYNSCEFIDIRSGKIQTNGGTVTYYDSGTANLGTKTAQTSEAVLLTTATSSQYLPEYHNTFRNLAFTGFGKTVNERTYMCANYNTYVNSGSPSYVTNKGSSYSGTAAGIWNIVNGSAGSGNTAKSGSSVTENGFTGYQSATTSGYVITGYSGTGGAIEIPATLGGTAVTEIGDFAFYGNTAITAVTLPSSVVLIGDLAFADCTALQTVTINGAGEVEIDAAAFRGCTALASATLTGVKYLRHAAFANCIALTAVTCPPSLVYFGANCFYNDDVALTIQATDSAAMTMEPYAFFFIGRGASITFTGISAAPETLTSMPASGNNQQYLYNCQEYLEDTVYTAGTWCYYWYHVAVPPKFSGV